MLVVRDAGRRFVGVLCGVLAVSSGGFIRRVGECEAAHVAFVTKLSCVEFLGAEVARIEWTGHVRKRVYAAVEEVEAELGFEVDRGADDGGCPVVLAVLDERQVV